MVPTRELALQVNSEINSLKGEKEGYFKSLAIYGGNPVGSQLSQVRNGIDILVATPGRLKDFLDRGSVSLSSVQVVCIDEADEMLKQGFQEDIEEIFKHVRKSTSNKPQTLLFSATIPDWVRNLSRNYQNENTEYIDMIK